MLWRGGGRVCARERKNVDEEVDLRADAASGHIGRACGRVRVRSGASAQGGQGHLGEGGAQEFL